MVRVLWLVLLLGACSAPKAGGEVPPVGCALDADCGKGRYCTSAGVCRSDCTVDAHCFGPSATAQCNAQGKCIETVDAASPPADDAAAEKPETTASEAGG